MIYLQKSNVPTKLAKHASKWAAKYSKRRDDGKEIDKWIADLLRRSGIKEALIAETCKKCAYCESKMLATGHGEVEHITPKVLNAGTVFDWNNLTLACSVCNKNKKTYDFNSRSYINPYVDDPEVLFKYYDYAIGVLKSNRAMMSSHILKLNRPALIDERREHYFLLSGYIAEIQDSNRTAAEKEVTLRRFFAKHAGKSEKYSAMVKAMSAGFV